MDNRYDRKDYYRKDEEPKVIAISATRQAVSPSLIWGLGLTAVAYAWLVLLPH